MALLRDTYNKLENIKGPRLLSLLIFVFVVFATVGFSLGYLNNLKLKSDELTNLMGSAEGTSKLKQYEGKVVYINPLTYPNEKISYILLDDNGKEIILLRAKDQKLSLAEGLRAGVEGLLNKTKDGSKDVLEVTKVIIKNGSN